MTYIKTKSRNYLIFEYYMIVLKDLWQVALFEFLFTYLCKTFYNFAKSPHFRERFGIKPKVDRSPFSLERKKKREKAWDRPMLVQSCFLILKKGKFRYNFFQKMRLVRKFLLVTKVCCHRETRRKPGLWRIKIWLVFWRLDLPACPLIQTT